MLKKTQDEKVVGEILQPFLEKVKGEDWKSLLKDSSNIFLVDNSLNNLVIFEKDGPENFTGHYFFKTARGRKAIEISKVALRIIFGQAQIVKGLTPLENKPAKWLSRQLGFTPYGVVKTFAGPCELFILTKQEWSELNG